MNNHASQLVDSTVGQSSQLIAKPWPTWLLILAVLVLHWLGTQWFVNWLGGEGAMVHAQTAVNANALPDDGWRRTSRGWEYKMNESTERPIEITLPSKHISPYQLWPAAAAACMLLLITVLPETLSKPQGASPGFPRT